MRGNTPLLTAAARVGAAAGILAIGGFGQAAVAADAACLPGAVVSATAAVEAVFGDEADVMFDDVACAVAPGATRADAAVAEPGSRTGGPVRFVLYAETAGERTRVGRLTATVAVAVPHLRTVGALDARAVVAGADVVDARGEIGRVPFAPLPKRADIDGARVRRPLPRGAVVTASSIALPALVQSGAEVVTVANVEGVEVRGRAVAAQSGHRGEIVIVVNPDSRKRLRGRVTGDALVEVLHVS